MNQNFYEPNMCYNSISFDVDQFQPPQFLVIHQPLQEIRGERQDGFKENVETPSVWSARPAELAAEEIR
nr:hypothetical protein [Tanacetum cinerariifolium]